VFDNPSTTGPPTIHRVHFAVSEDENWVAKANESFLPAASCEELEYCPAPHSGFVTKGDANEHYDQAGLGPPVRLDWIIGAARYRIPLGTLTP
jgi:signal peptidase